MHTGQQDSVFLRNAAYLADTQRNGPGSPCVLTWLEPLISLTARKRDLDDMSLWRVAVPTSYAEGTIDWAGVVDHPTFRIESATWQDHLLVVQFRALISVSLNAARDETNNIPGGQFALDQNRRWLPVWFEIKDGSAGGTIHSETRVEYECPDSNALLPISRTRLSRLIAEPRNPAGVWTEKVKWTPDSRVVRQLPAEREFQLSAFGLPEPTLPVPRSVLFGRWATMLGAVGAASFPGFFLIRHARNN